MTNETVLREVGPLLRNQNGSCYRIKNGADKKYVNVTYFKTFVSVPIEENVKVTVLFT